VSCQGAACPKSETADADAIIGGSDVIAEGLMPLLLGGFASAKGAEVTVENEQTVGNFSATLVGDEGYGDTRISPDEAQSLKGAGAGNMIDPSQEHIIAVDSLVTIVNPSNPVSELTLEQLSDVYSGRVTNWSALGGPDLAIQVVRHSENSGAAGVFNNTVFGSQGPVAGPREFEASDNVEAAIFVSENPGG